MTDEVRKWEDKPYGPIDSNVFSVFERDLMDDLKSAKGFRQVFWNSPSDANTVETDVLRLIQASEEKLEGDNDSEPETIVTVTATKVSYCKQLTTKFYGHKLREFGNNKIKVWQKVDNVKRLIAEDVLLHRGLLLLFFCAKYRIMRIVLQRLSSLHFRPFAKPLFCCSQIL